MGQQTAWARVRRSTRSAGTKRRAADVSKRGKGGSRHAAGRVSQQGKSYSHNVQSPTLLRAHRDYARRLSRRWHEGAMARLHRLSRALGVVHEWQRHSER